MKYESTKYEKNDRHSRRNLSKKELFKQGFLSDGNELLRNSASFFDFSIFSDQSLNTSYI